ncbi:S8 family serine peptidase [Bacillus sp. AFS001701]|nr:S8 family serine peptidase [Bacillus sp. AFS001701]
MKKIFFVTLSLLISGVVSTPVFAHDHMDHNKNVVTIPSGKEVPYREYGASITNLQNEGYMGKGIKIAVLDTGFDMKSREVNVVKGYNFIDDNDDYQDDNGHGTKIAGIIGAKKNGRLLLGVAPESQIYVGKIADENGRIDFLTLVKGIDWAIEQKVDIINLSVEFYKNNSELEKVIKKATNNHILIVVSSGNPLPDGKIKTVYPAKYSDVVSVGMLDTNGNTYSKDFSKKKTDVYAMGEDVTGLYLNNKMTYDTAASFATANATGTFALLMNKNKYEHKKYNQALLVSQYRDIVKVHSTVFDLFTLGGIGLLIIAIPILGLGGGIFLIIKRKKDK